jgi:hypothetical protein
MEVLLHSGTTVLGWRTADIHQAILQSFGFTAVRFPGYSLDVDQGDARDGYRDACNSCIGDAAAPDWPDGSNE